MTCIERARVDAHFAGTIAPEDERAMRAHLDTCEACRGHYRRRLVLARLDPEALGAEERIGRGLGLGASEGRRTLEGRLRVVAVVVAAAAALLLFLRAPRGEDAGFAARGDLLAAPATRIAIYRVAPGGAPLRVPDGASIRRGDELAFAYEDGAKKPRLMIFAVDAERRVYWFHPAWSDADATPVAIPIAGDGAVHELREAIRHPFSAGRLEIHGLFSDAALTVREVEAAVARGGPIAVGDAIDHVVVVRVEP